MPEDRFDLREIARSVLADLPEAQRAALMTELLVEMDGNRGLELLSTARAAISLRMQEIIDARYPLHELAEVYGKPAAVRARMVGVCVSARVRS